MYSFAGGTVYDPFMGTATTNVAAALCGRNSVGVEIDPAYHATATKRINETRSDLFTNFQVTHNVET